MRAIRIKNVELNKEYCLLCPVCQQTLLIEFVDDGDNVVSCIENECEHFLYSEIDEGDGYVWFADEEVSNE